MMKEIHELRELYPEGNSLDVETLKGAIMSLADKNKRYKLCFFTFLSKQSPVILFNEWRPENFDINIMNYDDFITISLKRTIIRGDNKSKKREITGSFGLFRFNSANIWSCFTSDSPDFFRNGLVRFIESYMPEISRFYLSSEEMRNIFEKLEEKLGCEIFVKKAVLYSHREEGSIKYHLKKPFQELFNEADNEERYVDKIEFDIVKDNRKIYHGFISRDGISYYYSGNINYLFNSILPLVANRGQIKSEIFEGKERKFGSLEIHPIDIVYPKDVLITRQDNFHLIKVLSKISRSAIAVYHSNPYIHLSFLDFVDGSNFDIFVTGTDRISIIPNFKCSMHSLMRVSEKISKDFGEGIIEASEETDFSLGDFIGE